MKLDYDLILIGGGITGCAFAALVDPSHSLKIAIIEANSFDINKPDPRVFAISRASERIFRSAGIWSTIAAAPIGHFRQMQVWDENGDSSIEFDSQQICEATLGYIIENKQIQSALLDQLNQSQNIDWFCPDRLEQLEVFKDYAEIRLESGKCLKTHLVVGADGHHSRVRDLAGIENKVHDYQQTALVCSVKTQIAHGDIARQRFLSNGPLAFLPLADPHQCSIVWTSSHEQIKQLIVHGEEEFHQQLESAFEQRLGRILSSGQRYSFPLNRAHAKQYVSPRIALIGDAAHRIHPLAGQGANLGFLDAASLAEVIQNRTTDDLGRLALLRRYERWRKGENLAVIAAMDTFKFVFGSQRSPLPWLRNQGMDLFHSLGFTKRQIMRKAMGLSGDLPKTARAKPSD